MIAEPCLLDFIGPRSKVNALCPRMQPIVSFGAPHNQRHDAPSRSVCQSPVSQWKQSWLSGLGPLYFVRMKRDGQLPCATRRPESDHLRTCSTVASKVAVLLSWTSDRRQPGVDKCCHQSFGFRRVFEATLRWRSTSKIFSHVFSLLGVQAKPFQAPWHARGVRKMRGCNSCGCPISGN